MKRLWKSSKFWVAVIGLAVVILNNMTGSNLDTTEIIAVMAPLLAYIFGVSIEDAAKKRGEAPPEDSPSE
jgi:hypothetical protein